MSKPKKFLSVILMVMMIFVLSSCGNSKKTEEPAKNPQTSQNSQGNQGTQPQQPKDQPAQTTGDDPKQLILNSDSIRNYSYKVTVKTVDGVLFSGQVWVKDNKMRVDGDMGGIIVTTIYDMDKDEMYLYDSQTKTATKIDYIGDDKVKTCDYLLSLKSADYGPYKKVGNETVDGKNCIVYELKSGTSVAKLYVWDKNGVILKLNAYENDKLTIETAFTEFQIGNVTDEMVSVPK